MYTIPLPISTIRTRARQEFERHRFVNKLGIVAEQRRVPGQSSCFSGRREGRHAVPLPAQVRFRTLTGWPADVATADFVA